MSVYADSSALVKLYAEEEGAAAIRALEAVAVSELARVEIPAALWRKRRVGEIDSTTAVTLITAFEADWFGIRSQAPRFAVVAPVASVLDLAARIAAQHELRAFDSVQLASGLAAREADPDCETFACFDDELRDAAAANGFRLIPAADGGARA